MLEQIEDYVAHGILPPPELRTAYEQLTARRLKASGASEAARVAQVVRRFEARIAWWNRDFPKDKPPAPLLVAKNAAPVAGALGASALPSEARSRQDHAERQERAALSDTGTGRRRGPVAAPVPVSPAPSEQSQDAISECASPLRRTALSAQHPHRPRAGGQRERSAPRLRASPAASGWHLPRRAPGRTKHVAFFLDAADSS